MGDVDVARVGFLCEAIEAVAWSVAPFSLSLGGTGVFSESRATRVLWTGIMGQIELLQELRRDLESTISGLGFIKDRLGFSPHITLTRVRPVSPSEELNKAIEALSRVEFIDGLHIPVSHLSLKRSTLGPNGASYDTLASFRLAG
ncbi:RNA 2',3'-cyclic phosphodiesterase [Dehalococcoidia bacterium]|nr:RNA 2',3'-cyclic phosphodiesterase [Dehalococcoidia bacterium]